LSTPDANADADPDADADADVLHSFECHSIEYAEPLHLFMHSCALFLCRLWRCSAF